VLPSETLRDSQRQRQTSGVDPESATCEDAEPDQRLSGAMLAERESDEEPSSGGQTCPRGDAVPAPGGRLGEAEELSVMAAAMTAPRQSMWAGLRVSSMRATAMAMGASTATGRFTQKMARQDYSSR
jgi:hypothetical protein